MKIYFNNPNLQVNKFQNKQIDQPKNLSFTSIPDKFVKQATPKLKNLFETKSFETVFKEVHQDYKAFAKILAENEIPKEKTAEFVNLLKHWYKGYFAYNSASVYLYKEALNNNNIELLKILAQKACLLPFARYSSEPDIKQEYLDDVGEVFEACINSKNPEIREIFNSKCLYNMATNN